LSEWLLLLLADAEFRIIFKVWWKFRELKTKPRKFQRIEKTALVANKTRYRTEYKFR
jgi:hypothetical protein